MIGLYLVLSAVQEVVTAVADEMVVIMAVVGIVAAETIVGTMIGVSQGSA